MSTVCAQIAGRQSRWSLSPGTRPAEAGREVGTPTHESSGDTWAGVAAVVQNNTEADLFDVEAAVPTRTRTEVRKRRETLPDEVVGKGL